MADRSCCGTVACSIHHVTVRCKTDPCCVAYACPIQGKVRDTYVVGDKVILVTTDRQSAFDRLLASIPFKARPHSPPSPVCGIRQPSALAKLPCTHAAMGQLGEV